MDSVVPGLSDYGKIQAVIGCVVVTIVAVIVVAIAIHLFRAPVRDTKTTGKVISVDKGQVKASFSIGDKLYFVTGSSNMYAVGDAIDIMYSASNPNDSRLSNQMSNKTLAKILLAVSVVVLVSTYISMYFTFKSGVCY